jgi:Family of unknown function (DUF6498)
MFKRKLTIPDYLLILVNLIPLYGVWFLGWDAKRMFVVYAMETVIVGIINVLKMMVVTLFVNKKHLWNTADNRNSMQSGWFFIFFFIIHYGFFVFVQTQIFFKVCNFLPNGSLLFNYGKIPGILGDDGKLVLLIFIIYYTAQSFFTFIGKGDYKNISMGKLMFEPYIRIFSQQLIVILGSMFLAFGGSKIFILIFIAVKIFFEIIFNYQRLLDIGDKREKLKQERNKLS